MQNYAYTARDENGAPVNGTLQAASINEVTQQLRAGGKYPISVKPLNDNQSAAETVSNVGIKIARADVIQLMQQLSIMVETGVTLSEALDCIASQAVKPNVKRLVEDLETQVQSGTDFSSALTRHPRSFPQILVALIKAAEKSGMLSKMIKRANNYLRDEQETLRRVKGALTYPGIMLAFAITTTIFLLAFVLPKFTTIFANKGAALPVPTRVLMAISGFITGHWIILILATGTIAIGGYLFLQTMFGRRTLHFVQLNTPLLGPMFKKLHLSRGLRMVGTMASSGVTLVDCVGTAQELCTNVYFRELWDEVLVQIQAGKQMSEPLARSRLVPRSVAQMIHSGEKSGKLGQITEQVAEFSEQELKETITELTRYIEPAMIVVMGAIIGGVALALMLPIFTISRVVAH
ncbi:MAG TPA: type II secretion system F family protein [Tepidisphaeraceae bacterium]|nr:type II secretion system F family protein [Tepidisphaeraceae bacterium]